MKKYNRLKMKKIKKNKKQQQKYKQHIESCKLKKKNFENKAAFRKS